MSNFLQRFLDDQSAATAIEYGLVASLIAMVLVTVVAGIGTKLSTIFTKVASSLP